MKPSIPVLRWAKRLMYFPFHLVQRGIVFLDERDMMANTSFMLKLIFSPVMLCEKEGWPLLRIFYRSFFYLFWIGASFLAYSLSPSIPVDLFFGLIDLPYVAASSLFLYVSSYQIVEHFSHDDNFKGICEDVYLCDPNMYLKVSSDETGSIPAHKSSNNSAKFKFSKEPKENDEDLTSQQHADVGVHNRRW